MGSKRLAVVVAHPDDDTYACAGTVALHADDPDFRFVLIHATSGEQGQIADPSLATRETLGAVREEEDRRSWQVLGREPDRHEWFGYPDGGLGFVPFEELVERIAGILVEEHPDVVLAFGPDGITGHPDHIMASFAATTAFHRVRGQGGEGFARLVWGAIPQTAIDQWNAWQVAAGEEPFDPERMYHPRGVPDEMIGLDVELPDAIIDRVLASIAEHRTQAGDLQDMAEGMRRESLRRERGIVAWPPWRPGDPVLADLFDGLD